MAPPEPQEPLPPAPRTPGPRGEEEDIFDYEEDVDPGAHPQEEDDNWEDVEGDSPEEPFDAYPRGRPPDDLAAYNALIKKAAVTYGVQLEEERQETCFLLNRLTPSSSQGQFQPMLPSML